jgi:hypothetical protein
MVAYGLEIIFLYNGDEIILIRFHSFNFKAFFLSTGEDTCATRLPLLLLPFCCVGLFNVLQEDLSGMITC